jgi:tetratricopeptide (TPR) repeat protein
MRMTNRLVFSSALGLTLLGCGPDATPEPTTPPSLTGDPSAGGTGLPSVRVAPVVITGYSATELAAEFERARSLLLVDRYAEAAVVFDRLRLLGKGRELGAPSVYNAGLSYEGLGDLARALERYRELWSEYPTSTVTVGGLVRLSRLLGYLEQWTELGLTARRLLDREQDLSVMDRIEALGAEALGLVELGQVAEAEPLVVKGLALVEAHRFGEAGSPPVQLAQLSFAHGEIRRLRSEQIHLVPVPPNFTEVLEQRCQGLLEAQSAYTEAMRSRDAHWSAMSGYRVGQLYQQLHTEAMQIPAPSTATTPRSKQLFEGAMRLRYRILLEKGLKMMDATVRLGERTGEASPWVARARQAKSELERAIADEKAALALLPFTEAQLQAALDELKARAKPDTSKTTGAAPRGTGAEH